MADIVSVNVRSKLMSGIKSCNTKPELAIRSCLHRRGFRFRCNVSTLPGKPDIVLSKFRAVIQVHGCLWHQHSCHLFKWPCADDPEKAQFWRKKIIGNSQRDKRQLLELSSQGWRVAVVWECAIKGKRRIATEDVINQLEIFLLSTTNTLEIAGMSDNK